MMTQAPASPHMPTADDGATSFDSQRLLRLVDDDFALLGEIVELFLEDAPGWVESLREAIANHDAEALRTSAHAVKGAVSNFAARQTLATATALEEQGRSRDLAESKETFEVFESEMAVLSDALRQFVEKNSCDQ